MKKLILLFLCIPVLCHAQQWSLVKDFNNLATTSAHDPQSGGIVYNGMLIYPASAPSCGVEPWVTDGTVDGTKLLMDIRIGNGFSEPEHFAETPNGVVFSANDYVIGRELYITDGTPEGTKLLMDIFPGETSSSPTNMILYNGYAYFSAFHPDTDGSAIWRTDGTEEGTELFYDISDAGNVSFSQAIVWNNKLFMSLLVPGIGNEPWVTDGTIDGTFNLKNIASGSDGSGPGQYIPFNEFLLFRAFNSSVGNEPYITDGTVEGTVLLKNINPGSGNSMVESFAELNGELFFSAQSSTGRQVWKSDGTDEGTVQVSSIASSSTLLGELTKIGDKIYFSSNSDTYGRELFVTDGTPEGTTNVTDINPGSDGSEVDNLIAWNEKLFFRAEENGSGEELWIYDPISEELSTIDILSGSSGSSPFFFNPFGDNLFFAAYDGSGYEPYLTDGTEEGTFALADLNAEENGISSLFFINLDGKAVFESFLGDGLDQLAVTDGTTAGTMFLTTFQSEEPSYMRHLTVFDNQLFLRADDGVNGIELWVSDGTTEGTNLHTDVYPGGGDGYLLKMEATNDHLIFEGIQQGSGSQVHSLGIGESNSSLTLDIWPEGTENVAQMTKVGDEVFFRAYDTSGFGGHPDLWKTDGTAEGTVKVKDYPSYGPPIDDFAEGSGKLWFFCGEYGTSSEWGLYTSDGTSDGTYQVKYFNLQEDSYNSYNVTGFNGGILFTVFIPGIGNELYYSDGTEEGTYLVKNIWLGSGSTFVYNFVDINGIAYFIANSPDGGAELWRTDATEEGTYQVIDLAAGDESGALNQTNFENTIGKVNGQIIFGGKTENGEFELFSSDGTPEGTVLLADINPFGSSNPHSFYEASGYVYFQAFHTSFGVELWRTNGLTTEMVGDIAPGALTSAPGDLQEWGDFLYFSATNGNGNRSLYKFDQRCIIPEIAEIPSSICLGEDLAVSAEIINSDGSTVTATWDFGNENVVEGLTANYTFLASGEQSVTLELETELGCNSETSFFLMVNETPVPSFELPSIPLCISEVWEPNNQTTGSNENTIWSWNFDGVVSDEENPTHQFSSSGAFDVVLSASNGNCEAAFNAQIAVYEPTLSEAIVQDVTCFGDETGGVEVEGEGNEQPVTFSIDGITFSDENSWENLEAGELTIFVQDGNGCIGSEIITIEEQEELDVSVTWGPDDGSGTLGFIDVTVVGGQPPYEYSIDGVNFQESGLFENLLAGAYEVIIIDNVGCSTTISVEVLPSVSVTESMGSSISIFPVPADQHVHLNIPSDWSKELLELVDLQGRVVATKLLISGQNTLNVSMLSNGMYLARIPATGWTSQIQIQH